MASAPYQHSSYHYRASFRSRATSFLLSLLAIALIIFLMIRLGVIPPILRSQNAGLSVIQLPPGSRASASRTQAPSPARKAARAVTPKSTPAPKATVKAPPPTPKPPIPWNVIPMSSEDFAAADISKKPTRAQAQSGEDSQTADASGSGSGAGSGKAAYGPGDGPGGESLVPVDWYTRPTDAQLAGYLPHRMQTGWGEVACRMIDHYHVEDCHELGETPGSGFARALRQAAWQFLVRPPVHNGKPMLGKWVRIHFDFGEPKQANP